MFDFRITADNGTITIIRARERATAIKLYCEAEGCQIEYVERHCTVVKVTPKKKRSCLL